MLKILLLKTNNHNKTIDINNLKILLKSNSRYFKCVCPVCKYLFYFEKYALQAYKDHFLFEKYALQAYKDHFLFGKYALQAYKDHFLFEKYALQAYKDHFLFGKYALQDYKDHFLFEKYALQAYKDHFLFGKYALQDYKGCFDFGKCTMQDRTAHFSGFETSIRCLNSIFPNAKRNISDNKQAKLRVNVKKSIRFNSSLASKTFGIGN